MVENHQDKRESKLPATEDKLQPLSSKDQREPDRPQNNRMRTIILRLGVFGYDKETKEYTPDGQLAKITKEYQPGKTFWDWLQLLIIPLLLASATIGFGWWQVHLADLQHQNDLTIANDQQQEATLKTYLDDMTTLLLDKKLGSQTAADKAASAEAAIVARAKTLLVLRRLADPLRKATVVQFLYEAHLISYLSSDATPVRYVIDLTNADLTNARLSDADLSGAHLQGAQLTNADLTNAHLQGADLLDADLGGADLQGADLTSANLSGAQVTAGQLAQAKSLKGATMFDGSIHP